MEGGAIMACVKHLESVAAVARQGAMMLLKTSSSVWKFCLVEATRKSTSSACSSLCPNRRSLLVNIQGMMLEFHINLNATKSTLAPFCAVVVAPLVMKTT